MNGHQRHLSTARFSDPPTSQFANLRVTFVLLLAAAIVLPCASCTKKQQGIDLSSISDPEELRKAVREMLGQQRVLLADDGRATGAGNTEGTGSELSEEAEPRSPTDAAHAALGLMRAGHPAFGTLEIRVTDEQGRPVAARVEIADALDLSALEGRDKRIIYCEGGLSVKLLAGQAGVYVSAGPLRIPVKRLTAVAPGKTTRENVTLRTDEALARLMSGWRSVDFAEWLLWSLSPEQEKKQAVLAARAEGFHAVAAASNAAGSDNGLRVPCWMSRFPAWGRLIAWGKGVHGLHLEALDWSDEIPLYRIAETVRAGGGLAIAGDLSRSELMDPDREPGLSRASLKDFYSGCDMALDGAASELPFDTVAGPVYDALALSGSERDEDIWFRVLSLGYRVPAVLVPSEVMALFSQSRKSDVRPARFLRARTYVFTDQEPGVESIAAAVRAGRTVCSEGPFITFTVDGKGPGAVLQPRQEKYELRVHAFSTHLSGPLKRIQVLRNNEVALDEPVEGQTETHIGTRIRILNNCRLIARCTAEAPPWEIQTSGRTTVLHASPGDDGRPELRAWTSPIYFASPASRVPEIPEVYVHGNVVSAETGEPIPNARVRVLLRGKATGGHECSDTGGYSLSCVPTAVIEAAAPGHFPEKRSIFEASGCRRFAKRIHCNYYGRSPELLAKCASYLRVREALSDVQVDFRLESAGR